MCLYECLPMKSLRNLKTDDNATPVIGPLVSSDRTTAKKGAKYTNVSSFRKSATGKYWTKKEGNIKRNRGREKGK